MISQNLPITKFGVNRVFRFIALYSLTEYRRVRAMIYEKCLMALKRNFPVIWCNYCQEETTVSNIALSILINGG